MQPVSNEELKEFGAMRGVIFNEVPQLGGRAWVELVLEQPLDLEAYDKVILVKDDAEHITVEKTNTKKLSSWLRKVGL